MKNILRLSGLLLVFAVCTGMGGNTGIPTSGAGSGTVTSVSGALGLTVTNPTTTPAVSLPTGTAAQVMLMNAGATAWVAVTMSGDATIGSTGVVAVNSVQSGATGTSPAAGDSSTKLSTTAFVANAVAALNPALSALYATTTVLPFTPAYLNGAAGVGATLISTSFGALTVDGITAAVGDYVLVKNQAAPAQQGLYTVTATGGGAAFYTLTRALDYDTASDILIGTVIAVGTGTTNGGTSWRQTTAVATVGTDAISYAQFTYPLAKTLNTLTAPDAGTRTATSGRYFKGDGTNWNTSSGSASGTGACGASTWASTLNSDAAPTCTQPNYTDIAGTQPVDLLFGISGTPTASQILPSACTRTLTFPADFTAANGAATSVASCGTNPSETDDYLVKVAGTQIGDVSLSTSCVATLTTVSHVAKTCTATQRIEVDAPATVSGANIAIVISGTR